MTTLFLRKSISRSPLRRGFPVVLLVLCSFALSPTARAVDPPPDGGYPNNNTAEGTNALFKLTTGVQNTALGFQALFNNTTGSDNTATGFNALLRNTTGFSNTANGGSALHNNTIGSDNTANGFNALFRNMNGSQNTANGVNALFGNTTGRFNTANGFSALGNNTTGSDNTANGGTALSGNTTGSFNTANGVAALESNTTGSGNTANGWTALHNNTIGSDNTANGFGALESNTTGGGNMATGIQALANNTTGFGNTANGNGALFSNATGSFNTADGWFALDSNTTGGSNIALGLSAGQNLTTGSNNIDIGTAGVAAESNIIRIGNEVAFTDRAGVVHPVHTKAFIAGVSGVTASGGVAVFVNSSGQLGTLTSSARFKQDIHSMDKASEAILALRPVTFRYKHELDPEGIPQFGLVAEQVEKISPDLVARDADGKVYTVRYEAVNAMLLNEFLKEHSKVEEQAGEIAQMKKQIEALTATVQKVSDQIALSKPAPQLVANP